MARSDDLTTDVLKRVQSAFPDWTHEFTLRTALWGTSVGGTTAREKYTTAFPLTNIVAIRVEVRHGSVSDNGQPGILVGCTGGALDAVQLNTSNDATVAGVTKIATIPAVQGSAGAITNGPAPGPQVFSFPEPFTIGTDADGADIYLVGDDGGLNTTALINAKITIYMNDPDYTYPAFNEVVLVELADL
jgi:hypothetical protein